MDQPLQGITIRPMVIEDYEAVYALWIATPGMGLNSVDDSRDGIAKYLKRNPGLSFVALDGGEIVGAILCGHDGRRGLIHHTAVSAGLQRRGIGKALVDAAADALRREGIAKIWMVVFKRNGTGNAFWDRLGFEVRDDLNFRGGILDDTAVRIDT